MSDVNLNRMNYGFILDGSASMEKPEHKGSSRSRWKACQESTEGACIKVTSKDPDGIDLALIINNGLVTYERQTDSTAIEAIFADNEPWGDTPIHLGVKYFVDKFIAQGADVVPCFIFVVTDGVPDDQKLVIQEIQRAAKFMKQESLADHYFTLFFLQVGEDPAANAFLSVLDEKIAPVCEGYDLVDVKTFAQLGGLKIDQIILNAIAD